MTSKLIEAADELRIFTTSNRGINYDLLDALKRNPLIISAGDNISGKAHETIVHQRSTIARLESELTARESAGEVKVKPLVWEEAPHMTTDDDGGPRQGIPHNLRSWVAGPYTIIRQKHPSGLFIVRGLDGIKPNVFPHLKQAMKAAQSDYTRSALAGG